MNFLGLRFGFVNNLNNVITPPMSIPEFGANSVPVWKKYDFTFADFTEEADRQLIPFAPINANTVIHAIAAKITETFGSVATTMEGSIDVYVTAPTDTDLSTGILFNRQVPSAVEYLDVPFGSSHLQTIIDSDGIYNVYAANGTENLNFGIIISPEGDIVNLVDLTKGALSVWILTSYITEVVE